MAAIQSTNNTSKKPRRTGGVVGRGGGSSKPKSCGLNEAIDLETPTNPAHRPGSKVPDGSFCWLTRNRGDPDSFWASRGLKSTEEGWQAPGGKRVRATKV